MLTSHSLQPAALEQRAVKVHALLCRKKKKKK